MLLLVSLLIIASVYSLKDYNETVNSLTLQFPVDKKVVEVMLSKEDLDQYKYLMTVRIDRQASNTSSVLANVSTVADTHLQQNVYISVTLREKYKFDCRLKYFDAKPSSQFCVRRFEITQFMQPGRFSMKFTTGPKFEHIKTLFSITSILRRVEKQSLQKSPLAKYSSVKEAFKLNSEFYGIGNVSFININESTVQNSGLLDSLNKQSWLPTSRTLTAPFHVPYQPKQRYFLSSRYQITSNSQFEYGGRARTLQFSCSINDNVTVTDGYLGDLEQQRQCMIIITGGVTFRSCLEFYEIFPHESGSRVEGGNVSVSVSWQFKGSAAELYQYQIVVVNTLHVLPNTFSDWAASGITDSMIDCMMSDSFIVKSKQELALLRISDKGLAVSVTAVFPHRVKAASSSLPFRMLAMEDGIRRSAAFATEVMGVSIPDLQALVWVGDESHLSRDRLHNCSASPPPIFAQNRDFKKGNLFVLFPDFSFFSDFKNGHDHGSKDDVWFHLLEHEQKSSETGQPGVYSMQRFEEKQPTAIFRGRVANRRFGYLRAAVESAACQEGGLVNSSSPKFVRREDMCRNHQAVVTVPGNGVWSWATKFNMMCNSVSMLVPPDSINGESWETRTSLGMRPWVHYLPITTDKEKVCRELKGMVVWMREHQSEAEVMAARSRNLVFKKLGRESVLRDVAQLLLDYASLNRSRTTL